MLKDAGEEHGPLLSFVLCSWERYVSLTALFSTQEYKWVRVVCQRNLTISWVGKTEEGAGSLR